MTASVPQGNWTLHPQKQNSCRTWASGCSTVDELTWSSKQSICLGQMALTVWVNRWAWIFIHYKILLKVMHHNIVLLPKKVTNLYTKLYICTFISNNIIIKIRWYDLESGIILQWNSLKKIFNMKGHLPTHFTSVMWRYIQGPQKVINVIAFDTEKQKKIIFFLN